MLQRRESLGNAWTMTFILPHKYQLKNVPQPKDTSIRLEERAACDVAAMVYHGTNTLREIHLHELKLSEWLNIHSEFQTVGEFFTAQYDAPFVIPFLKRNEVQIEVRRAH